MPRPSQRPRAIPPPSLNALHEAKGAFWNAWPWFRDAWTASTQGVTLPEEPFIACLLAYEHAKEKELEDLR